MVGTVSINQLFNTVCFTVIYYAHDEKGHGHRIGFLNTVLYDSFLLKKYLMSEGKSSTF
jgi:hypothetical protein